MARPKKATVEYFPHFVNHGKTMFTIENRFGNDGYAFWFKLLELLGSAEQHFLNCNDIESWEFLLAKTKVDEGIALKILDLLSKLGAINSDLWNKKIIRSDNFIENLSTVYRRREVMIDDNATVLSFCMHKHPLNGVSVDINPQSKVKESKVKESKVDICTFGSQKNVRLTDDEYQRLLNEFPETNEAIEYLSLYMIEKGDKSKSKTHNATLRRWVIDAVREKNQKREVRQKKVNTGNFKQRQYSEEQLNALIQ